MDDENVFGILDLKSDSEGRSGNGGSGLFSTI